jgi:intracellular septation protein
MAEIASRRLNPLLKLALELGPLGLFFFGNAYADRFGFAQHERIFVGTAVFIVATVIALGVHYALVRKLPIMPLVSGVVVWSSAGSRSFCRTSSSSS